LEGLVHLHVPADLRLGQPEVVAHQVEVAGGRALDALDDALQAAAGLERALDEPGVVLGQREEVVAAGLLVPVHDGLALDGVRHPLEERPST
jgi:hypothetical protein